jgi:uncharacterized protein YndB with AHSA1/START domain
MQRSEYSIEIKSPRKHVWKIMLDNETYEQWAEAFSENSRLIGEWKEGTEIDFLDPERGGTRALVETVREPEHVVARHIAMLSKDREPESDENAEKWIDTVEEYKLNEKHGITTVEVHMEYHPDFAEMFDSAWPEALKNLKGLCEK